MATATIIADYPFRTTHKQDKDTFVEDRGYPFYVVRGDENFATVNKQFGKMLADGQTAKQDSNGDWIVSDGFYMLDDKKAKLIADLEKWWKDAEGHSYVDSAVGFKIDANERANRDINGLITALSETNQDSLMFCDADNQFHQVTLDNLKTMRLELIQRGQEIYTTKWTIRSLINEATKLSDLDNIEAEIVGSFNAYILSK